MGTPEERESLISEAAIFLEEKHVSGDAMLPLDHSIDCTPHADGKSAAYVAELMADFIGSRLAAPPLSLEELGERYEKETGYRPKGSYQGLYFFTNEFVKWMCDRLPLLHPVPAEPPEISDFWTQTRTPEEIAELADGPTGIPEPQNFSELEEMISEIMDADHGATWKKLAISLSIKMYFKKYPAAPVDRIPRTKDGVPIFWGDTVYTEDPESMMVSHGDAVSGRVESITLGLEFSEYQGTHTILAEHIEAGNLECYSRRELVPLNPALG